MLRFVEICFKNASKQLKTCSQHAPSPKIFLKSVRVFSTSDLKVYTFWSKILRFAVTLMMDLHVRLCRENLSDETIFWQAVFFSVELSVSAIAKNHKNRVLTLFGGGRFSAVFCCYTIVTKHFHVLFFAEIGKIFIRIILLKKSKTLSAFNEQWTKILWHSVL